MSVNPSVVILPVDTSNTGKKIDNVQITNENSIVVQRQVLSIGDPSNAANRATVDGFGRLNVASPNVTLSASNPTIGTSSSVILASNVNAKYRYILNNTAQILWLTFGGTALVNQGLPINPGGSYEMSSQIGNLDTRAINGVLASGSAAVSATEGV